jgi:hypothetical protein
VTGAVLPVVTEAELPVDKPRIVLGNGAVTRKLLRGFDAAQLPPDAIVIKTIGRDLIMAGHPRRGPLYAVYTFLEDTIGIRWWTATEVQIPKRPTLTIARLDTAYAPKIVDRATRYLQLSDGCFTDHSLVTEDEQKAMGIFSARMRLNGHDHYSIPDEYGAPNGLIGWVHTFYQIIDSDVANARSSPQIGPEGRICCFQGRGRRSLAMQTSITVCCRSPSISTNTRIGTV